MSGKCTKGKVYKVKYRKVNLATNGLIYISFLLGFSAIVQANTPPLISGTSQIQAFKQSLHSFTSQALDAQTGQLSYLNINKPRRMSFDTSIPALRETVLAVVAFDPNDENSYNYSTLDEDTKNDTDEEEPLSTVSLQREDL